MGETATCNGAARLLLPQADRESVVLYASPELLKRAIWPVAPPPEIQRLRDRIWTEIKSA